MSEEYSFMVSGVGAGRRHVWDVTEFNGILTAFGLYNKINVNINLRSSEDISNKFKVLDDLVSQGLCLPNDVLELREIVRLRNGLDAGGNGEQTRVDIGEAVKVKTIFKDGEPKKVVVRKKIMATSAQEEAAANARQYAHTEEADSKRRKSINARRDAKILGEV